MQTDHDTSQEQEPAPAMPLLIAAHLQDHLMSASNDLERLQRLLADACEILMTRFHGAAATVRDLLAARAGQPDAEPEVLRRVMDDLGVAVTALQFQDMASQLIHHTHLRLRSVADKLAREAFGDDPEGAAIVTEAPLRPNPVTQDEMDAGSVELF
jgi:hypothetical protein